MVKTADDVLAHYGILGMRWGVRRDRGKDGRVGSKKAKTPDQLAKAQRKSDSKNRRQLSDKELLEKIGRLEREKKLRELTRAEVTRGRHASNEILKDVGKRVAVTVASAAVIYGIRAALQGNFSPSELADALKPKK